jgi:hypothetical protein
MEVRRHLRLDHQVPLVLAANTICPSGAQTASITPPKPGFFTSIPLPLYFAGDTAP